jgi:hypothetical protein
MDIAAEFQTMKLAVFLAFLALSLVGLSAAPARAAGVFSTPRFVEQGHFALGLEPELVLSHGAGLAANARFTYGLTDLNNAQLILGTGSGPRRFRAGGNFTFDFFPDVEKQPGIGLAFQGMYYQLPDTGTVEVTALPYIHKTFISGANEVEPYFSLPFGMGFTDGRYQALETAVVGAMFKSSGMDSIRYVLEFGVAINHTESYFSGGFVYYH